MATSTTVTPRTELRRQAHQRGQVVDVLQALADGLEDDRERRVPRGHLQQLGGALPLLPQRRAPARVAARKQQSPGGALPEARGEQRDPPTSVVTISSISSGSNTTSSAPGGSWSVSGIRSTMPSSEGIAWASMP